MAAHCAPFILTIDSPGWDCYHLRVLRLLPAHIKQRIGVSLLVCFRSLVDLKPHVFIKAFCLRVLFVDCKPLYSIVFDPVADQLFSQPLSSFFWHNEKHFKHPIFYPHKGDRRSHLVLRNQQMGDTA